MAATEFNIARIKEIQSKFAKGENLFVPGRCFVREGVLTKICRKGPKKRHFFLFDDILVYGTPFKGNLLSNQTILQLSEMGVSGNCHYAPSVEMEFEAPGEDLTKDLAFQVNHTDKSFHVFASSENDRENWIKNLTRYISRSRGDEDGENPVFSPVWLPDITCNNCMLCNTEFTIIRRKHHCRECGRLVCSTCSSHEIDLMTLRIGQPSKDGKLERVCDRCFVLLQSNRKERGSASIRKAPSESRPPRPSRPPAVITKKEPPPRPVPYAVARKSIKVNNDVKPATNDVSDESEDTGDSEGEDSITSRDSKTGNQGPTNGGGTNPTGKPDRKLSDSLPGVEPYPAVVRQNTGTGTTSDERRPLPREKKASPPRTIEEKKAIFADSLIQIKPPPVPLPRKTKEGGEDGPSESSISSPTEDSSSQEPTPSLQTPKETTSPASPPPDLLPEVDASGGKDPSPSKEAPVKAPPRRKRQSKFIQRESPDSTIDDSTPVATEVSQEVPVSSDSQGVPEKDTGSQEVVQISSTLEPVDQTAVDKTSRLVGETSSPVSDPEIVDKRPSDLSTDVRADSRGEGVFSGKSVEDDCQVVGEDSLVLTQSNDLQKDPSDPSPSEHNTEVPHSLLDNPSSSVEKSEIIPVSTSDPTSHETIQNEVVSLETTSVAMETAEGPTVPVIVTVEQTDTPPTLSTTGGPVEGNESSLQVTPESPKCSPGTARKKARGRKNKFS
jgi:hypothetical protein